jgi:hypothetical protein
MPPEREKSCSSSRSTLLSRVAPSGMTSYTNDHATVRSPTPQAKLNDRSRPDNPDRHTRADPALNDRSVRTSQAASGHAERRTCAQIARRDAATAPRGPLRARSPRDLVDQGSAYACPMRAYARPPRRTTSTCLSPRNRSSPATSRRARPAYARVGRTDKAPRNPPEKLGSSTRVPPRTRWSGRCAYAKRREDPDELVAGVGFEPTTFGL